MLEVKYSLRLLVLMVIAVQLLVVGSMAAAINYGETQTDSIDVQGQFDNIISVTENELGDSIVE